MDFKGKTVLITGGASGIGYLCGKCFSEKGANIVLIDFNEEGLKIAEKEIGNVLTIKTDVRNFSEVKDSVEKAIRKFNSIDILINCAGGNSARIFNSPMEFCDRPIEHIDWGIDVNLKGVMYYCHEVLRNMRENKKGVIINLGSITGEDGDICGTDYSVAKSGIMYGLTKSLAQLGAKYGIRVCCVSPGPILTRPAMAYMKTLMGRAAETQELVDFIMYLASEKAAFITGVNYFFDGGRNVMPRG